MQLKPSLAEAITRLTAAHVPSPRMNAELLLMFTLNVDRAYLHAHPERELTAAELAGYQAALAERARGVPAQYITGHQEFWGLDFIVTPAVLIPRPETEHLIETVLELLTPNLGPRTSDPGSPTSKVRSPKSEVRGLGSSVRAPRSSALLRLADIGTGSGCIAIALAKELPHAEIHATDISPTALEIARANAARLQLETRIHFHQADLLAGLSPNSFDFIVSNPPYVGESEADQVQLEVRTFEPRNAVFAGPTGTEVIARLIPQAHAALRPGGWLVLEISATIAPAVTRLLEPGELQTWQLQSWKDVHIAPDLQSIPRIARARKPSS
ncbi:MAG TPA: peptide chain release factor N(5)-glutamine methyltransferase [Candidatus Sulfotelmatobacter sp.]|nr:peptide chain release factor N(5)-glutamine methyltransferase [Candidatus Sulfotelmatobacter sp.]